MADDKYITELDDMDTPTGAEYVPVIQGGANKKGSLGTHLAYLDADSKLPDAFIKSNIPRETALVDRIVSAGDFDRLVAAIWNRLMEQASGGIANAINATPAGAVAVTPTIENPWPINISWDPAEGPATAAEIRQGAAKFIRATEFFAALEVPATDPLVLAGGTTTLDLNDGINRAISLTANSTLEIFDNLRAMPWGGIISGVTSGAYSLTFTAPAGVTIYGFGDDLDPPQTADDRFAYTWFAPTPTLILYGKAGEVAI